MRYGKFLPCIKQQKIKLEQLKNDRRKLDLKIKQLETYVSHLIDMKDDKDFPFLL